MKVLLISANFFKEPYPVYPLGLDYVAKAISDKHEVEIIDINNLEDYEALGSEIKTLSPNIIGLSIRNIDNSDLNNPKGFIGQYQSIVQLIREHSKAPIVLGGSGFTIFPSKLMEALKADYGIIGEGERLKLLLDSMEKMEKKEKLASIPGVITQSVITKGVIARGEITQDSDEIIPPPLESRFLRRVDKDLPHVGYYLKHGGMLNLQTKRGCSFRCVYCTYPHIEGRKLRLIPPKEVAKTALKLQEAGAKFLFITDSAFNVDQEHSMAVAKAFQDVSIKIPWGAFFAPRKPPAGYFKLMADSGLTHAEFGTESLSDPVLKAYEKPFTVNHVFKAHKAALDAGLHVAHFFLFGGPGEKEKTVNETLANVDKIDNAVLFFFCGMRIYSHTKLYKIALKEGQISKDTSMLDPIFYKSHELSSKEIINRVKEKARGRMSWQIGGGDDTSGKIVSKMHSRGHVGPLWEHLI